MRTITFLFICVSELGTIFAAPPEYPDPLTRDQLTKLIEEAGPERDLPGRLEAPHLFPEPTSITLEVTVPGERMKEQEVKIQTKASDGEYLIMERRSLDGQLLQTDVLRYHWESGLFHRWMILPDPKAEVRLLLGERFLDESSREKRISERENRPKALEIVWKDLGPGDLHSQMTLLERFVQLPNGTKVYQYTKSETQKGQRIRREFARFVQEGGRLKTEDVLPDLGPDLQTDFPMPDLVAGVDEESAFDLRYDRGDFGNKSKGLFAELADLDLDEPSGGDLQELRKQIEELRQKRASLMLDSDRPTERSKPAKEVFETLNFSYQLSAPGFVKLDPKKLNPAASLCYLNQRSQAGFLIIAENGGMGVLDTEQLSNIARERLKAMMRNAKEVATKTVKIDELPFLVTTISGARGSVNFHYTISVTSHNGQMIQMIYYQTKGNPEECEKEGIEMAKGFHFLDRDKKIEEELLAGNPYENRPLGVSFAPGKVGAKFWNQAQVWQKFPAASYGALLSPDEGMIVVPLDLHGLNPTENDLAEVFLLQTGLNFQNQIQKKIPLTQGSSKGVEYHAQVRNGEFTMVFRVRVLRNQDTAVMLSAFGKERPGLNEELKSLLDSVEISKPLEFSEREKLSEHRKRDAPIINMLGLQFLNTQRSKESLSYFERSRKLAPESLQVALNLLTAKKFSGDSAGALKFYQEITKQFPNNLMLQSHEPFLLLDLSRRDEAVVAFAKLFERGFHDEAVLLEYLNLLNSLGKVDQAIEAIDGFLKKYPASGVEPRRWQYQVYTRAEKYEESLKLTEKLAAEFPNHQEVQQDLMIALIDAGKPNAALEKLEKALKEQPKNVFLIYQKGRAHQVAEEYQKAKEAYEDALDLAPNSQELSKAIALVSALLGQGDQSAIRKRIEPVEIPKAVTELLEQAEEEEAAGGFNHRVLKNVIAFHFQKGTPFKTTRYRTVRVFNQGGVEETKTIRFSFDPTFERAFLNKVEVISADGQTLPQGGGVESYVSDVSARDGAMGTTQSVVTATVPGLKPGCLLRYSYTVETVAPLKKFPFSSNYFLSPGEGGAMAMVATGNLQGLGATSQNGEFETLEGEDFRAWVKKKVPTYYIERIQPDLGHFLPFVAIGDQSVSWERLGLDYLQSVNDRLVISPEIQELAKEVVGLATDEEEMADAIMRYVQDQLVYQAIEFGRRARIPAKAEVIARNRYGDCKDHSLLAYQLCKAAGISAHLTLVHTAGLVVKEIPSLDQFNHMIVYLPSIRGGTYFDGTEKYASVERSSPINLVGKQVLILNDSPRELGTIPYDERQVHSVEISRSVSPDLSRMEFKVEEEVTFRGGLAASLRSYLLQSNEADWTRMMEKFLGATQPIAIQSFEPKNVRDADVPLVIKMRYSVKDLLKEKAGQIEASAPAVWENFFFAINRSGERRTPFEIGVPLRLKSTVTLKLPETHQLIEGSWKSLDEDRKIAKWTIRRPRPMVVETTLALKRGIYQAKDYQGYADALRDVAEQIKGNFKIRTKE